MKRIQLVAARIRNFKGIQQFEFDANGESVEVHGQNGAGKTSIVDAFTWVLFGKDSQDRQTFQVKPVDSEGQEIHNIETEVELAFKVDGVNKTLKRIQYEKYTKRKGVDEPATFKDETKYYIDEVPIKTQKEYTAAVNELINDKYFKLLTNPLYFNTLDWKDRRAFLIDLLGEIDVDDVIAHKKELEPLLELLANRTPEELRLINADKKSALDKEETSIPARIDEVYRSMPQLSANVEESKEQSQQLQTEIDGLQTQRISIQSGAAITTKRVELTTIDAEISVYRNNFMQNGSGGVTSLQATVEERESAVQMTERKLSNFKEQADLLQQAILRHQQSAADMTTQKALYLQEYRKIEATQYEHPAEKDECPSCQQALPKEQADLARQMALEAFNLNRTTTLEKMKQNGLSMAASIKEQEQFASTKTHELTKVQAQIAEIEQTFAKFTKDLEKARTMLENAKTSVPDITNDIPYLDLMAKRTAINNELTALQTSNNEVLMDLDNDIMRLRSEKQAIDANLTAYADVEAKQQRIMQLEAELGGIYESLETIEHVTHLLNEFDRTKISLLDERVANIFTNVRFKLYHEQKNGGLAPVCETLYKTANGNLVSWQNGLNTAAKINSGLEIIEVLQQKHECAAPIFIDNRESVTELYNIDTQLISLVVSPQDAMLRVVRDAATASVEQQTLFEVV